MQKTPILRSGFQLGLALLLLVSLGACRPGNGAEAAETESAGGGVRKREIPPVRVIAVERREMVRILETTSKLESEREIQLFPRLGGLVTEVLVEEGDTVAEDEVLARLEDQDELLRLREAEVLLSEAEDNLVLSDLAVEEALAGLEDMSRKARQATRDYERDLQLSTSKEVASPLSKQAVEASELTRDSALYDESQAKIILRRRKLELGAAKTAVERAQVSKQRAELDLSYKVLRAPFAGIVARREIRTGRQVTAGDPAFVLTDLQTLRAVFARPEDELALFARLGDGKGESSLSIRASADAFPDEEFEGWVERISPTIDPESGKFRVIARLEDESEERGARLLPGMYVRMQIITDRHPDALVVPKRSLRREGERRYLLVIEDGPDDRERTVRRADVDEGYKDDDSVEIVPRVAGELTEGDEIVLVGSRDLIAGDAVRIEREGVELSTEQMEGEEDTEEVEPEVDPEVEPSGPADEDDTTKAD